MGNRPFNARKMAFNYDTGKGIIYDAATKQSVGAQGEMNVNSSRTKFIQGDTAIGVSDVIYNQNAIITTCDHPNPHFGLRSKKQKIVPDKVVVTGPANLEIGGLPTPIFLPFGAFPLNQPSKPKTGLLFNNEIIFEDQRGIGIQNLGWFFPINEYVNLAVYTDLYLRGTFAIKARSAYFKRYKYRGDIFLNFNSNRTEDNLANKIRQNSIGLTWKHNQDNKAHPNQTFGASVNFQTNDDQRRNQTTFESQYETSLTSNVNYSKTFTGTPFSLRLSANHSQNTQSRRVSASLPNLDVRMRDINPFKAKKIENKDKWYNDVILGYGFRAKNQVTGTDTTFFDPETWREAKIGAEHKARLSTTIKFLEFFNFTPSVNYTEAWYLKTEDRFYESNDTITTDSIFDAKGEFIGIDSTFVQRGELITELDNGFKAARIFDASMGVSTQIFGTRTFSKGYLRGIRHTIRPSVSMSYSPNYLDEDLGYFDTYIDANGEEVRYNVFPTGIYARPTEQGRSFRINYSVNNTFEGKLWSKKDSTEKKFKFFDRINVGGNYNMTADSFQWSRVSVTGNTRLFKNITTFQFNLTYDPYAAEVNENGVLQRLKTFHGEDHLFPLRFERINYTVANKISVKQVKQWIYGKESAQGNSSGPNSQKDNNRNNRNNGIQPSRQGGQQTRNASTGIGPKTLWDLFEDWNISHNFKWQTAVSADGKNTQITTNNISIRGNLPMTEHWRVTLNNISYDFRSKNIVYPDLGFYRDLHCWEMSFNWQPQRNAYYFRINVKPGSFFDKINVPYRKTNFDFPSPF